MTAKNSCILIHFCLGPNVIGNCFINSIISAIWMYLDHLIYRIKRSIVCNDMLYRTNPNYFWHSNRSFQHTRSWKMIVWRRLLTQVLLSGFSIDTLILFVAVAGKIAATHSLAFRCPKPPIDDLLWKEGRSDWTAKVQIHLWFSSKERFWPRSKLPCSHSAFLFCCSLANTSNRAAFILSSWGIWRNECSIVFPICSYSSSSTTTWWFHKVQQCFLATCEEHSSSFSRLERPSLSQSGGDHPPQCMKPIGQHMFKNSSVDDAFETSAWRHFFLERFRKSPNWFQTIPKVEWWLFTAALTFNIAIPYQGKSLEAKLFVLPIKWWCWAAGRCHLLCNLEASQKKAIKLTIRSSWVFRRNLRYDDE